MSKSLSFGFICSIATGDSDLFTVAERGLFRKLSPRGSCNDANCGLRRAKVSKFHEGNSGA